MCANHGLKLLIWENDRGSVIRMLRADTVACRPKGASVFVVVSARNIFAREPRRKKGKSTYILEGNDIQASEDSSANG